MQRQTTMIKPTELKRKWFVVDAKGQPLGRLASQIAEVLTGKAKPTFTPHIDTGDFVIILNAKEVSLSGNKLETKTYYNNSRHLGGLRKRSAATMVAQYPVEMVERAVWGMLPKGPLGRQYYRKLFVYEGSEHPHAGQNPQPLKINQTK